MLRIPCPYCGCAMRPSSSSAGPRTSLGPDSRSDDRTWTRLSVHAREPRGIHYERWLHAFGCGRWFNVRKGRVESQHPQRLRDGRGKAGAPSPMSSRRPGPYRLERGGSIDRSRRLNFRFNGRTLRWLRRRHPRLGAARQRRCARWLRSFKFHRPRGIFSAASKNRTRWCSLARTRRTIPSVRAPALELTDGLEARAHAGWPSLGFDIGRALDFVAPLWSAGFYNKTFMWPSWHSYESIIRRMAGLGHAPTEPDPDRYDIRNIHCDVLVVGGGRAGLAAAHRAARAGARVVLTEQDRQWGGKAAWNGASYRRSPGSALDCANCRPACPQRQCAAVDGRCRRW